MSEDQTYAFVRKLEARIEELEKEQLGQQVADEKVKYWQGEIERVERNDDLTRKLLHAAERRVSELEERLAKAEELLGGCVLTHAEMDELAGYPLDHELMAKFTFKEGEEITPKTLHEALERYHQERKK